MIEYLKGTLERFGPDFLVLDVGGTGHRVFVPSSASEKLPPAGSELRLYIAESVAMYGGGVTLYGFPTESDRDLFYLFKESVPGAGAKKALDYLDKIAKSLPDFRRCIAARDPETLTGVFGFTRKTAEKLISALKDKLERIPADGVARFVSSVPAAGPSAEAVAALCALGYREGEARDAVRRADTESPGLSSPELIRTALRIL